MEQMTAEELFEDALKWLGENYPFEKHEKFFKERDIVWTLQKHIKEKLESEYQILNDFTLSKRKNVDLVIIKKENINEEYPNVEVVAEFKYEPSHERKDDCIPDILKTKFPVIFWDGFIGDVDKRSRIGFVGDVEKIKKFVENKQAEVGYAVLIDEGNYWIKPKKEFKDFSKIFVIRKKINEPGKLLFIKKSGEISYEDLSKKVDKKVCERIKKLQKILN